MIAIPTVLVGTAFKGAAAKSAIALMRPGDAVQLVREPNNQFDPLAVACHYRGLHVGYIPRQANPAIARALDAGRELACTVREPPVVHGPVVRVEPKLTVSWESGS